MGIGGVELGGGDLLERIQVTAGGIERHDEQRRAIALGGGDRIVEELGRGRIDIPVEGRVVDVGAAGAGEAGARHAGRGDDPQGEHDEDESGMGPVAPADWHSGTGPRRSRMHEAPPWQPNVLQRENPGAHQTIGGWVPASIHRC